MLAVEWDDHAAASYKLNFPDTDVFHGDVCSLSVEEILQRTGLKVGDLDILDGSPPCQGFSTAGKRIFEDDRNQLFRQYVRILRGLKPKCFVMENVSGMVKGKFKLIFAEVMRELKQSGYKVQCKLMNSMYFGVSQSRERLIFIGVREDLGIEPSHPKPFTKPITLYEAIGELGSVMEPKRDHVWIDESPTGTNSTLWHRADKVRAGEKFKMQNMRLKWNEPCPTITKGFDTPTLVCGNCHPQYTRALSVLEVKRICSFPDDFKFADPWQKSIMRMGNAVPPLLMKAIAEHIYKHVLSRV